MAKTTTKYVVGTEEFANLGLVGKFLGKKITKKDVEAGKYPEVTLIEVNPIDEAELLSKEEVDEALEAAGIPTEEVEDESSDGILVPDDSTSFEATPELDQATKRTLALIEKAISDTPEEDEVLFGALCDLEDAITEGITLTDEQTTLVTALLTGTLVTRPLTNTDDTDSSDTDNEEEETVVAPPKDEPEYPEIGDFKDEKAMKKFIKGLSDEALREWCYLEGAEYKECDHESINRMRMAMAIKSKHFPTTAPSKGKKSKSKYASYSTEDLVSMALEHDVEVPDDKGDMRICRMYTIMALKKAGLLD
jgi:hypothetical protein